ncbi:MAG: hypothetical protein CFE45_18385, partial [Burkholderiales bacterium PBB5]
TLDHAATVGFVSADYFLPDTAGGISLLLSAVPAPGTGALWLAALPWLALQWRRRASAQPASNRRHSSRTGSTPSSNTASWPTAF